MRIITVKTPDIQVLRNVVRKLPLSEALTAFHNLACSIHCQKKMVDAIEKFSVP